jgi:sugar O-acyltransferase (sialic acid O-acetyltransferase NeuD family)
MKSPVVIIGSGGHAKVLIDSLKLQGVIILGFTDFHSKCNNDVILEIAYIGEDQKIHEFDPKQIHLVNGLGSIGDNSNRRHIYQQFLERGYTFANVVHPASIISSNVVVEQGCQIMAGAIVQPGCRIGQNSIVNTKVSIDHDCYIGDHVHLAPGVTLSGGITVGDNVHVGTGAVIIQGIKIGNNAVIGAGAVVLRDVREGATVFGVPARDSKK